MPTLYKKCPYCNKFHESQCGLINAFCPDHQSFFDKWILARIAERFIPIDAYDVYQKEEDTNNYFHVCRSCGAKIVTKKGKISLRARQCYGSIHKNTPVAKLEILAWSITESTYRQNLYERQEFERIPYICQLMREQNHCEKCRPADDPHNKALYYHYLQWYWLCEECHRLTNELQIHHKTAVSLLTPANWQLTFDLNNCIALCKKCHSTKHGEVHKRRGLRNRIAHEIQNRKQNRKLYNNTIATTLKTFLKESKPE